MDGQRPERSSSSSATVASGADECVGRGGTPVYTPSTAIQDPAGNAMAATPFNGTVEPLLITEPRSLGFLSVSKWVQDLPVAGTGRGEVAMLTMRAVVARCTAVTAVVLLSWE